MKKGDLVTVKLEEGNQASNTYVVYDHVSNDLYSDEVILFHPLHPEVKIVRKKSDLNKVQANLKDSTERALEYALKNEGELDHNLRGELEALRMFYVVNRTLTNHQKNALAGIGGLLASIKFHNEVDLAMTLVNQNQGLLTPFNLMWYTNFRDLFNRRRPITSPKQRTAIFNIAGSVLAELERTEIPKKS